MYTAVNLGLAPFQLEISKQDLHLVKSITCTKDKFTPLHLTNIVKYLTGETNQTINELPATIEYYTALKTMVLM